MDLNQLRNTDVNKKLIALKMWHLKLKAEIMKVRTVMVEEEQKGFKNKGGEIAENSH